MASINFNIGFDLQETAQTQIWKDLSIPIRKNKNNFDLKPIIELDAIKNSMNNIFKWEKGERILNPDFGNPLTELLYQPINTQTEKAIGGEIANAINQWEPRVKEVSIKVTSSPDTNEYYVTVEYSIPTLDINANEYTMILGRQQ